MLFRWRSFTPVPVLLAAIPLLWRSRGGGGPAWAWTGLLLCLLGQALRAWVLGQVPDGTSGIGALRTRPIDLVLAMSVVSRSRRGR